MNELNFLGIYLKLALGCGEGSGCPITCHKGERTWVAMLRTHTKVRHSLQDGGEGNPFLLHSQRGHLFLQCPCYSGGSSAGFSDENILTNVYIVISLPAFLLGPDPCPFFVYLLQTNLLPSVEAKGQASSLTFTLVYLWVSWSGCACEHGGVLCFSHCVKSGEHAHHHFPRFSHCMKSGGYSHHYFPRYAFSLSFLRRKNC